MNDSGRPVRKTRPGLLSSPWGLALTIALALIALWLIVEIGFSLVGIATSPLGWLLSLIGTLIGLIAGKTG